MNLLPSGPTVRLPTGGLGGSTDGADAVLQSRIGTGARAVRLLHSFGACARLPRCEPGTAACAIMPRPSSLGKGGVQLHQRERKFFRSSPEARRLLGIEKLTNPGLLQDREATAARIRYICAELMESDMAVDARDRLKAAELLARLDGAFAPERHLVETSIRRTPDEMRAIVAREVGALPAHGAGADQPTVQPCDGASDGADADQPLPVRAVKKAAKPKPKAKKAKNAVKP